MKLHPGTLSSSRYVTSFDTGNQPVTDIFHFVVFDADKNRLDNQMFTITITSKPSQPPVVTVRSGMKVCSRHTHTDTHTQIHTHRYTHTTYIDADAN